MASINGRIEDYQNRNGHIKVFLDTRLRIYDIMQVDHVDEPGRARLPRFLQRTTVNEQQQQHVSLNDKSRKADNLRRRWM
jgi:hypothetical protein